MKILITDPKSEQMRLHMFSPNPFHCIALNTKLSLGQKGGHLLISDDTRN